MLFLKKTILHLFLSLFPFLTPSWIQIDPFIEKICNFPLSISTFSHLPSRPRIFRLTKSDPYEMGLEQGKKFRYQITTLYPVLIDEIQKTFKVSEDYLLQEAKKFEAYIPQKYIDEMKGIADGASLSYDKILIGNTILDIINMGCSVIATDPTDLSHMKNLIATNHFSSHTSSSKIVTDSLDRFEKLSKTEPSTDPKKQIQNLQQANVPDTLQAILFDTRNRSIIVSAKSSYAASGPFWCYHSKELFDVFTKKGSPCIALARNLDWPVAALGPQTIILIRPSVSGQYGTSIVTWPGYIGALSGMNSASLALSISAVPSTSQKATPNALIFREVLEKCQSTHEALLFIQNESFASAMNLLLADQDHIAKIEIDPIRSQTGYAHLDK